MIRNAASNERIRARGGRPSRRPSAAANTFGARVFVGSEMALASVPALAISVDAGYYRQPEPFVGFEPGGMGVSIAAHWYVK